MGSCSSSGKSGSSSKRLSNLHGVTDMIASGVTSNSCAVKDYAACAVGNSSNQDRFSVCASPAPKCFYGGVFDGHGEAAGAVSAEAAAQNVATRLIRGLNAEVSAGAEPNCDELIRQSFKLHQQHCARVYEEVTLKEVRALKAKLEAESGVDVGMTYPHEGGTTATVALTWGDQLTVGWVGDSRGVMASLTGDSQLRCSFATADHGVGNASETERVTKAGGVTFGKYFAVNGCDGMLQLSRSLGDVGFHRDSVVSAEPEVWQHSITQDDAFLLMASDGVWTVFDNDELVAFVYRELEDTGYTTQAGVRAEADAAESKDGAGPSDALLLVAQRVAAESTRRARARSMKVDDVSVVLLTFPRFWDRLRQGDVSIHAGPVPGDATVAAADAALDSAAEPQPSGGLPTPRDAAAATADTEANNATRDS